MADPVSLLLAELDPILRRHLAFGGTDTHSSWVWPINLAHLLSEFGTFILQRQLYLQHPTQLPPPDINHSLARFYDDCPSDENIWYRLTQLDWPCPENNPDNQEDWEKRLPPHYSAETFGVTPVYAEVPLAYHLRRLSIIAVVRQLKRINDDLITITHPMP